MEAAEALGNVALRICGIKSGLVGTPAGVPMAGAVTKIRRETEYTR